MSSNKYVLDRFDDGFGVFLLDGLEDTQLLIQTEKIPTSIKEGDIVMIEENENGYKFSVLHTETINRHDRAKDLIEKLRNK